MLLIYATVLSIGVSRSKEKKRGGEQDGAEASASIGNGRNG